MFYKDNNEKHVEYLERNCRGFTSTFSWSCKTEYARLSP